MLDARDCLARCAPRTRLHSPSRPDGLLRAAQALKEQMRLRHPEYYAGPIPSPANVSVSGNSQP